MSGERVPEVLRVGDTGGESLRPLVERYGIGLTLLADDAPVPGSFWGAPEAGIIGPNVFVRNDTPLHSFLHETSHIICMAPALRTTHTGNAGSDDLEESAVCFLQIVLADELRDAGRERIMDDMDSWGYSFRLGNTRRWFQDDAEDARAWLLNNGLIGDGDRPTYRLRETV